MALFPNGAALLYDKDGNALAVQDGVAIPASTPTLVIGGSDGGTARYLGVDAVNHALVAGRSAVGVAPTSNPVLVSGVDAGGLKRIPQTDTSGRLLSRLHDGTNFIASTVVRGETKIDTALVQDILLSTGNSSTANLNAGATFTGTSDTTLGVAAIQVNLFATQNCTVKVQQSTDGTNWDIEDSYTVTANIGDGRTIQATASFVRVLVTNNGIIATTSLRLQTVLCPIVEALPRSLGQKTMAKSLAVTMASDQTPLNVILGSGVGLPLLVNLVFDKSDGAIVANAWKEVVLYTVPVNYNAYLLRFSTYMAETGSSRIGAETLMATLSIATNVYTAGTSYVAPQFTSIPYAVVTTNLTTGSGNVTVTVGYTNELGVAGRTGTFTIPKGSLVGSEWEFTFQGADLGMISIQSASASPTLAAGVIEIQGLIQLAYHENQSTTLQAETIYPPGMIGVPSGTKVVIYYNGGTVAKQRQLFSLLQLVAI